jgi:hypothetical protein
MSAGSDASNLGYGHIYPNSNVNAAYVNIDSSHYPGGFGSNEIPGLPGLAGAKSNVDAAAAYVPGICLIKGGALKRKIKNITRKYKMKGGKKAATRKFKKFGKKISSSMSIAASKAKSVSRSLASSLARSLAFKGGRRTRRKRGGVHRFQWAGVSKKRRSLKGGSYPQSIPYPPGYGQYQNNLPMTPTYSVGGVLDAKNLGLANPPPISVLCNSGSCTDNYNHYTGQGFASRGH